MTKKKASKKELKRVNKNHNNKTNDNMIGQLLKIVIIIVVAFALFYLITYFVTKNNKTYSWENSSNTSVIQYDEIMFGTLLKQNSNEYYVLAMSNSNENKDIYNTYISMYKDKESALKFYTIDLDSDFNKSYISEKSNFNISKISDLKVKGVTLLKVKNKVIVEYVEGNDKVIEKFKQLVK